MRKILKKIALSCVVTLCCIVALALIKYIVSGFGTVGLEYRSNGNGTCYVSGFGNAKDEDVIIPIFSPNGDRVTGIGTSAFEGYTKIKTVTLHSGIESIGADAFYGCDNLEYTRYDNALYIGNEDNPYSILYKAVSTEIDSVDIHPDTEMIYGSAFSGCEKLLSVDVPSGVRGIGAYAFAWCESLESVSLANSVGVIEEYAFLDCDSLSEITIPLGVEKLDFWTFAFCDGLERVDFDEDTQIEKISDFCFYSCGSLESFDFGKMTRLKSIGYAAFADCSNMKTATIPNGEIKIGELAFLDCGLENVDEILALAATPQAEQYVKDIPENIGVLNMILKAKQLKNLNFFTEGVIPQQVSDIEAGKMHVGMPYSSTRFENTFVPNFVSLYSFITSTKNPNSYLYTVDLGDYGNENGHTFYGAVCSTYVNYTLGIEGMYTTHQWAEIPGMRRLEDQSLDALRLGDTIVGNGHVLIVTGIAREPSGSVHEITIMDISQGGVRERVLTPQRFYKFHSPDIYTYYRYDKLYRSRYETTPFILVYDKTPKTFNFNLDLIPRRGDKANWIVGADVEIDVFNLSDYTGIEIYRDETLIETRDASSLVVISGLEAGKYKARLIGQDKYSDFCYWIMVDAVSEVKPVGKDGMVRVRFSATNAKPIFMIWQHEPSNGAQHIEFFTYDEMSKGQAIGRYISGTYKVRVAFETEYGVIFSMLPEPINIP